MRLPSFASLSLCLFLAFGAASIYAAEPKAKEKPKTALTISVRATGAVGDGKQLDTNAINRAITQCAESGGGMVVFPAGKYLTGTILLRSHVNLRLEAGSEILGSPDLEQYRKPAPETVAPFRKWGNWHRALILGQDVEDVTLCGEGTINGNKVFDPAGEEYMRGPHAVLFIDSRRFTVRDLTVLDSANYGVFFLTSDDVNVERVTFIGGWDGVHYRGTPERFCHNVNITGCRFYTGDDSIAGNYWENTVISNCTLNSSCNGIRLIGPANRLIVHGCLFYGPGEQVHRSSDRTNMLSGIILQPGSWDDTRGPLDHVLISENTMCDVESPVVLVTKPGNKVGRVTICGLQATGVYGSAMTAESWMDEPIDEVVLRDINVEYTGGAPASDASREIVDPKQGTRPLPVWGFYARNVRRLVLQDVRLSFAKEDHRPVMLADRVPQLQLDNFKASKVEDVAEPILKINGTEQIPANTQVWK